MERLVVGRRTEIICGGKLARRDVSGENIYSGDDLLKRLVSGELR